jgi:hypothetical protein
VKMIVPRRPDSFSPFRPVRLTLRGHPSSRARLELRALVAAPSDAVEFRGGGLPTSAVALAGRLVRGAGDLACPARGRATCRVSAPRSLPLTSRPAHRGLLDLPRPAVLSNNGLKQTQDLASLDPRCLGLVRWADLRMGATSGCSSPGGIGIRAGPLPALSLTHRAQVGFDSSVEHHPGLAAARPQPDSEPIVAARAGVDWWRSVESVPAVTDRVVPVVSCSDPSPSLEAGRGGVW